MTVTFRGLLGVAVLLLGLAAPAQAQVAERPNLVLVVTDDQRWDTPAFMPTVSSELVGRGVTFTNAFAVNPLCCPSRASILTGTYSHTNGVWGNSGAHSGMAAFDDRATLATWLDEAGYETMLVGKYLNGYAPANAPFTYVPPGWDRWLAFYGSLGYFSYTLTDGAQVHEYGPGPAAEEYSTDVLADEAVRFLQTATSPLFLYFAPFAPHQRGHMSVDPAPRHVDAFAGAPYTPAASVNEADVSDKPLFIRRRGTYEAERLTEFREEQLEALLAVDDAVGRLLQALRSTGKLRNTLFLFTSDNGMSWGEHRWVGKRFAYDESLRVPLVARWDALGAQVRTRNRLALNVDLASTLTEAAGVAVSGGDGRSLLPVLRGDSVRWRSRFVVEYHDPPFFQSYCGTRSQQWKYVQYRRGEEELYNLAVDPGELGNLARDPRYRALVMDGRARVLRSACRPPGGFEPLKLCSNTGTAGVDTIRGTAWRDWICAEEGNDRVRVRGGDVDVVRCGPGRDTLIADRLDRALGCEIVKRG